MTPHTIFAITLSVDCVAVLISIISTVSQVRSSRRLDKAVKDLHESHDELHNFLKRIQ